MHKPLRTLISAAVIGILASGTAQSGGFSLYTESSAAATGNFAAGIAAEAADASIGWYNPAGLVLLRNQEVVMGGIGIFPVAKLSGTSNFSAMGLDYTQHFDGISGGENAFVPDFHYALPLGENATFGLSVVAPFGLATDWGVYSPVRYQGTFTELITTNISPEIGGRLSENFSVGAGLDLQYARVKFNRILGLPILIPGNPTALDSLTYNKGSSYGVGYHVGVMGMFNDNHTRVGLNYQSRMRHTFHGFSQLTGKMANKGLILAPFFINPADPNATYRSDDLYSNSMQLPDIVTLSAYHDMNETIALLGSIVYTGWSSFKTIQLNNVAAPNIQPPVINQVKAFSVSPQNYSDVWRFALGANYHVNQQLMLRVGGGYDATPTNDVDRDVRLPDTDRWALSVGAHYQARSNIGLDVGYTHLFAASDPVVNRTDPIGTAFYNVSAVGNMSADLVGAQVVWVIDKEPEVPTK